MTLKKKNLVYTYFNFEAEKNNMSMIGIKIYVKIHQTILLGGTTKTLQKGLQSLMTISEATEDMRQPLINTEDWDLVALLPSVSHVVDHLQTSTLLSSVR